MRWYALRSEVVIKQIKFLLLINFKIFLWNTKYFHPNMEGYHLNSPSSRQNSREFWNKRDALCSLASFVQFEKREKHPWRSITFCKVAGFYKKQHSSMGFFHVF